MIKTLKTYGAVCGAVVSLLAAGAAVAVGVSRFRKLSAPTETGTAYYARPGLPEKPKRNRTKPAPAKARK